MTEILVGLNDNPAAQSQSADLMVVGSRGYAILDSLLFEEAGTP